MLPKPQTKMDLLPPFQRIGEPDWENNLRQLLNAYAVPLPTPIAITTIVQREQVLRLNFPPSLRLFLTTFGPIDFDGLRLLPAQEIDRLEQLWFKSSLTDHDQARLSHMIQIAETGSDNVYALDLDNQLCCLCSHDPAGFFEWLPSFDDLIRMALIDLSWSYFGWPDPEIADMATVLKSELFNW